MKKTVKKLMAILLTVILFASVLPIQSFAVFDSLKAPVVEYAELSSDNKAISIQELDFYYNELFAMLEENDITLDDIKELLDGSLYDMIMNFDLSYSNIDYNVDITLKSGEKLTVPLSDSYIEYSRWYEIGYGATVSYEDYLEAKENGESEIELQLYANIISVLTMDYSVTAESYQGSDTAKLVDCFVKSITPVSGIPSEEYYDSEYIDLEGATFIIEYADGSTKTAEVVQEIDFDQEILFMTDVEYYLDGESFYADCWDDYDEESDTEEYYYHFSYLDANCRVPVLYSETSLFKSVEITDCVFDANTAILSSISYELTYQNGEKASFTREFTEQETALMLLGLDINALDGYFVEVGVTLGDLTADKIRADEYIITVSVGNELYDTYSVENPNAEKMNLILNIADFFTKLIIKIRNIFDMIFIFSF